VACRTADWEASAETGAAGTDWGAVDEGFSVAVVVAAGVTAAGCPDSPPPQPAMTHSPLSSQPLLCTFDSVITFDPSTIAEALTCPGHESLSGR
ncbi:MAG: hypothetical protein ACK55P_23120, partial [Planctomyces sp.]